MNKIILSYKDRNYTEKEVIDIIERNNKMQLEPKKCSCPLCGCELFENDLFVCEECGQLLPIDDKCREHWFECDVCRNCCSLCQEEFAESSKEDDWREEIC